MKPQTALIRAGTVLVAVFLVLLMWGPEERDREPVARSMPEEISAAEAGVMLPAPDKPGRRAANLPAPEAASPAAIEVPVGPTVRLIIEGLSAGESATYLHRRGDKNVQGSLSATEDDPNPSVLLERIEAPVDAKGADHEQILVSAPGYGSRGFPLDPDVTHEEILCPLVRSQPLRVEFPRLVGLGGYLEATLTWSDPAGGAQQSGIRLPHVTMRETRVLDHHGHATFEATLVPSHPILSLGSTPPEGGHDRPVTIFETSVSVDAQRTALTFEDLEVHLVEFLPPTPGTAFRLQFRPEAPSRISLPEGTRSRGWTNSYGFHGGHRLRSDVRGRLLIYLPPSLKADARISAAPLNADRSGFAAPLRIFGQHVQGDPEWEGLEPITIETSGAIPLVLEEEE